MAQRPPRSSTPPGGATGLPTPSAPAPQVRPGETATTLVSIGIIIADPRAQSRAGRDEAVVAEYAEAMEAGAVFPPLVVFEEGNSYWLAEGFHRLAAAVVAGWAQVACDVRPGGLRAAILHSVGANATHGLRRTNADKRRCVAILLDDREWRNWNNSEIARRCAVDEGLVRRMRPAPPSSDDPRISASRTVTRGGKVFTMDTARIGRRPVEPAEPVAPAEPELASQAPVLDVPLPPRAGGGNVVLLGERLHVVPSPNEEERVLLAGERATA